MKKKSNTLRTPLRGHLNLFGTTPAKRRIDGIILITYSRLSANGYRPRRGRNPEKINSLSKINNLQ